MIYDAAIYKTLNALENKKKLERWREKTVNERETIYISSWPFHC